MKSLMKKSAVVMCAAGLVLLGACAYAQEAKMKPRPEGPPPASGEIVGLDKASITVKDHKGVEHKFKITAETRYGSKKNPAKFESLEKGDHVIVTLKGVGDSAEATAIRELPARVKGVADAQKKDGK